MSQREIPFLFMRGGTSRGPYFNAADLPSDRDAIAEILLKAVGAGHPLNIDGIGGGNAVTNKVAMLSKSADDDADIDYFFAQVSVTDQLVDFRPTCGNILSGVGPAAIEMGLIPAVDPVTEVRIRLVNTGALVVAKIQTPGGIVRYDGDTAIDGLPGTAARIDLQFMGVVGAVTGKMLPTGNLRDQFEGVEVTCMDVAKPIEILWQKWKLLGLLQVGRWAWEMCANLSRLNSRCLRWQRPAARLPRVISCRGRHIRQWR